jgi:glycosyltransferase involved in cell wall biosynthesis
MKILQIGKYFPPYKGGIENNTYHCCIELSKDHEVSALVFNNGPKTIIDDVKGIPVIRVGSLGKIFSQEVTYKFVSHIRRLKPDVIHLHSPNPIAVVSILLAAPHTPLVITHHADIIGKRYFKHFVIPFYKMLLEKALFIILYTEWYGHTSNEVNRYKNKFHIIPHGTNETPFILNQNMASQISEIQNNLTKGAPTISFIGRHVKYKGVDNLLHAVKALPGVHALIGGRGPTLNCSKKLAHELEIHNRVHFLEEVNDYNKGAVFRASDVFVLPCINRAESFGQSLVEAQLSKIPTVVCNVNSGVLEVTEHEKTGLIIKPNSVNELIKSIKILLDHEDMRRKMGEAGYQRAKTYYVEEVTGPKLRELFNDVATCTLGSEYEIFA